MNGIFKVAALAALLASAAAFAQEPNTDKMDTDNALPDFSTLDTNGELDGDKNGKLSSDEYQKAVDRSKAPNP